MNVESYRIQCDFKITLRNARKIQNFIIFGKKCCEIYVFIRKIFVHIFLKWLVNQYDMSMSFENVVDRFQQWKQTTNKVHYKEHTLKSKYKTYFESSKFTSKKNELCEIVTLLQASKQHTSAWAT